ALDKVPQVIRQLGISRDVGRQNHIGFHDHAARFIGGADDAAFGHGGMGQQCGFNIRAGDIVTGGNDHVVGSRLVPKVTVVIHYIRVAGDVPAPLNVFALPVVGKIAAAGRA